MSKSKPRYWQQRPCPEWCKRRHRKYESGSDRDCMSGWDKSLTFSLMDSRLIVHPNAQFHDKAGAVVYLTQPFRSHDPSVTVETVTERGQDRFELTTSEALRLAQVLTRAVDIAEGHAGGGQS